MKIYAKKIIYISIFAYVLWTAFNVIYGMYLQIDMFKQEYFSWNYYWSTFGFYIGSWITYVLFIISTYECINTLVRRNWHSKRLIIAGLTGILGYAVPKIVYYVYSKSIMIPSIYSIIPMYILVIGLIVKRWEID